MRVNKNNNNNLNWNKERPSVSNSDVQQTIPAINKFQNVSHSDSKIFKKRESKSIANTVIIHESMDDDSYFIEDIKQ